MNLFRPGLLALILLLAPASAGAAIEFVGTHTVNGTTRFYLADPEAGTRSGWIDQRQTFAGYSLFSYNETTRRLEIEKGGTRQVLWPHDPSALPAGPVLVGNLTATGGGKTATSTVFLRLNRENFFVLANGVVIRVTPREQLGGMIRLEAQAEIPSATGISRRTDAAPVTFSGDRSGLLNFAEDVNNAATGFRFSLRVEELKPK